MPEYKYQANMTCGGCSGAIERVVTKKLGDNLVKIDFELGTPGIHTYITYIYIYILI